jgi:hypothetical protein
MKRTLFLCLFLVSFLQSNAQMTLEHAYPTPMSNVGLVTENASQSVTGPVLVNLAVSGKKYAVCQSNNLNLYNLDHSLWKSIPISDPGNGHADIFYISENLFKLDNKIEFGISYMNALGQSTMYVKDEDGITLNTINGIYWMYIYKSAPDSSKAIVMAYPNTQNAVYALPGNLPCEQCSSSNTNVHNVGEVSQAFISDPVPNPANGQTRIDYRLPTGKATGKIVICNVDGQTIKTYDVNKGSNTIIIETSDLSQGIYYYSLQTTAGRTSARKMLIIK